MAPVRRSTLLACIVLTVSFLPESLAQTCANDTFSGNRLYATCSSLTQLSASVHWTYHATNGTMDIAFRIPQDTTGWTAWAINPSGVGMLGANAMLAYHDVNAGAVTVISVVIPSDSYAPVIKDMNLTFAVYKRSAEYVDGAYIIYATVELPGNSTRQNIVWQAGTTSQKGVPNGHQTYGDNVMSSRSWDFRSSEAVVIPTPSDGGSGESSVMEARLRRKNIHGVFNALSWGTLFPLGVILARYMRVFPSLDPAWFYVHITCQCSGYILGVAGWGLGLKLESEGKGVIYADHRNIGIALFCLATLQVFALLMRPKKTVKIRFYWNLYHWSVGYTVVILSIINVFKGITILQPDQKYKHAYNGVVVALGAIAFILEIFTLTVRFRGCKKSNYGANGTNGYSTKQNQMV